MGEIYVSGLELQRRSLEFVISNSRLERWISGYIYSQLWKVKIFWKHFLLIVNFFFWRTVMYIQFRFLYLILTTDQANFYSVTGGGGGGLWDCPLRIKLGKTKLMLFCFTGKGCWGTSPGSRNSIQSPENLGNLFHSILDLRRWIKWKPLFTCEQLNKSIEECFGTPPPLSRAESLKNAKNLDF